VNRVVRPQLLPHLRTIDEAQISDAVRTLELDGFIFTLQQVLAAMVPGAPRVVDAGWPGPLPRPAVGANVPDGPHDTTLNDYADALCISRLTILELLQGAEAVTTLVAAYPRWRSCVAGEAPTTAGAPTKDLAVMWELAAQEENWGVRAALLHLAVWRLEASAPGVGRLARLVMNTVRAAAGHTWLSLPPDLDDDYRRAVTSALTHGDAGPWAQLLVLPAPPLD